MSTNDIFSAATVEVGDTSLPTTDETSADRDGQLRLLDTSDLPLQFRLDRATRERGLAHVAEVRRLLARNAAHRAA
jgi:hypothetical protein